MIGSLCHHIFYLLLILLLVPFPIVVMSVFLHSSGTILRNVMLCGFSSFNENKAALLTHKICNYIRLYCVTGN